MVRRTKEAFLWITKILGQHNVSYQVSGGMAARIYGSRRKLADIDIDMNQAQYKKIMREIRPYIVFGPKIYKDKNWRLELITLRYKNQFIDLGGIQHAKIFNSQKKKWLALPSHLARTHLKKVYGIEIPVEDKKELLSEKKELGRKVDKMDVKSILWRNNR